MNILFITLFTLAVAQTCPHNCRTWFNGCDTCSCDPTGRPLCTEHTCDPKLATRCEEEFKAVGNASELHIQITGKPHLRINILDKDYSDPGAVCYDHNHNTHDIYVTGDVVNLRRNNTYVVKYLCEANSYITSAERIVDVGPVVCTKELNPVCCEKNTYGNACEAEADACLVTIKGECEVKYECFDKRLPIDHEEKTNKTHAFWSKEQTDWCCKHHNIACPAPCRMVLCSIGYKLVNTDDRGCGGVCVTTKDELHACTEEWRPVCCKQTTYGNECKASSRGCSPIEKGECVSAFTSSESTVDDETNYGLILGLVGGGLVVLGVLAFLIFWFCRRQKKTNALEYRPLSSGLFSDESKLVF